MRQETLDNLATTNLYGTMKILAIHNAYQQYGGEDIVARLESELLDQHGNACHRYVVSNKQISGVLSKIAAAFGVVFSFSSFRTVRKLIQEIKPDVVHVHNFFPLISPSVFYACNAEGVPVVLTLHNYRIICPTAVMMHAGVVTERSIQEGPWWSIMHRVYRGSLTGTFLLCLMIFVHLRLGTWRNMVDRIIVLSQFAHTRFSKAGIPTDSMVVKPNFVDIPPPIAFNRSGLLFVGRLSPEKGIEVLLSAANSMIAIGKAPHRTITVVGAGPLAKSVGEGPVLSLGALPADAVEQHMQRSVALLLPSIWYEGFPMVLVEAYANGLPVIASRIGALAELVEDGVTGLLFEPGNADDLTEKMVWALTHPDEMRRMGDAARARYEALYTPERNYEQLVSIYQEAIISNARKRQI